jgi:hypothetical protein
VIIQYFLVDNITVLMGAEIEQGLPFLFKTQLYFGVLFHSSVTEAGLIIEEIAVHHC